MKILGSARGRYDIRVERSHRQDPGQGSDIKALAILEGREVYAWIAMDAGEPARIAGPEIESLTVARNTLCGKLDRQCRPHTELVQTLREFCRAIAKANDNHRAVKLFKQDLKDLDERLGTKSLDAFDDVVRLGANARYLVQVLSEYREGKPDGILARSTIDLKIVNDLKTRARTIGGSAKNYVKLLEKLPPALRENFWLSKVVLDEAERLSAALTKLQPKRSRKSAKPVKRWLRLEWDTIEELNQHLYATTGQHFDTEASAILDAIRPQVLREAHAKRRHAAEHGDGADPEPKRIAEKRRRAKDTYRANHLGYVLRRLLDEEAARPRGVPLGDFEDRDTQPPNSRERSQRRRPGQHIRRSR